MTSSDHKNGNAPAGDPDVPIFLLGFARSGTTWMTLALRKHLGVGMVNEGTFIVESGKRFSADEPLTKPQRLVAHIERHEFSRILHQGYGISVDWDTILREQAGGCYADYIQAALADIATQLNCPLIGSKCPGFGRQPKELMRHFPRSLVIHLIRDGRDCALSHYRQAWGRKNAYVVASMWRDYIQRVRQETAQWPDARYLEVRYEDLLQDPVRVFQRIVEFVLSNEAHKRLSGSASDAAERFAAQVKPDAFVERAYKWKTQMTARDIEIFDSVAGSTLETLGYDVSRSLKPVPVWRRAYYWLDDKVQREWIHKKNKLAPKKRGA